MKSNVTFEKAKARTKAKQLRGARKKMWVEVFLSVINGSAVNVADSYSRTQRAIELIRAARLIADTAVQMEFDNG